MFLKGEGGVGVDTPMHTMSTSTSLYQLSFATSYQPYGKNKKGVLKFLNVYYLLTMLVEKQKFLFFLALIENYQHKAFRYN